MFKADMETLVSQLENLISSKLIVGESIVIGSTTIIPIVTASVGFGLGSGEGTDHKNEGGKGSGGGGGLKLVPSALLIVQGDQVQVYSLAQQKGCLDKLAELIPEIIDKCKLNLKVEQ